MTPDWNEDLITLIYESLDSGASEKIRMICYVDDLSFSGFRINTWFNHKGKKD